MLLTTGIVTNVLAMERMKDSGLKMVVRRVGYVRNV